MKRVNEFKDIENDITKSKKSIESHLSKFNDIDKLLNDTKDYVKAYFEEQSDFGDMDSFKSHLIDRLRFYKSSFSLSRKERKSIRNDLDVVEQLYSHIIYYGEFNPIVARNDRLSKQVESEIGRNIGATGKLLDK